MAICKMCHKTIPDGMDFCEECELKRTNQADESYLDSLLSSVSADLNNYSESVFENVSKHIVPKKSATTKSVSEDIAIEQTSVNEPVASEPVIEEPVTEAPVTEVPVIEDAAVNEPASVDTVGEVPAEIDALFEEVPLNDSASSDSDEVEATVSEEQSDEDVDELLDSLLADMDSVPKEEESSSDTSDLAPDDITDIFESMSEPEAGDSAEGDQVADVSAVPELDIIPMDTPDIIPLDGPEAEATEVGLPGIEEIDFSSDNIDSLKLDSIDALDAAASVADSTSTELGEPELEQTEADSIGDFDVASVMSDIDSGDFDKKIAEITPKKKKTDKQTAKNWFDKLFGNIVEEKTPEQIQAEQDKLAAEEEKKKQKAEDKKAKKAQTKEEKEAQKAQQKVEKEELAKKKAEEKRAKAEEAKAKAQKKKEERLALEAAEALHEGRINRVGATILFVIFAILTVIIIVGTNIYSYNLSIKNAQNEFNIKHYNDAYYEVYGLKIQDEDIDLYDKIMTVMYVNTQLNAYDYYMRSNNKELALDSLLKGLQRYDKYLELATILDIEDDLNYVKSNILTELQNEFGIDEVEAVNMVKTRDDVDYSEYIYALLGTYEVEIGE